MIKALVFCTLMCFSIAPFTAAQPKSPDEGSGNRIAVGRLANGATVAFIRADAGTWGIDISGDAVHRLTQPKPAQIEVYRGERQYERPRRRLPAGAKASRGHPGQSQNCGPRQGRLLR